MFNNSVCAKCHLLSVRIFFFVTFNLGRRLGIRIRTVAVCVSLPYGTLQTKKHGFLLTLG